ncbi:MAG TPA: twin-arginine translocase TatA/TatE family subunit [Candidatus Coprenecus stercoripullorum]|nr:twin-arginine translocase TatA/TatE family subunit [Candidatus Coprenecus stercoripullorum]
MGRLLFLGSIGITEILVLVLIVLLLFGAGKLPKLMKDMGKGVRSFREGVKGTDDDDKDVDTGGKNGQPSGKEE